MDHAGDLAVELQLRFDEQTVTGLVMRPGEGDPVEFKGWLGLLGVLEGLRDDPSAGDGSPREAVSDGRGP